jgi:chemotaxis protein CheZ
METPVSRLATARNLCDALETGDEAMVEQLIGVLNEQRSKAILRQLAALTREVHHSFSGVASDPKLVEITKLAIPDTRDRLHYVVEKTEESAHRTLGAVEDMLALTDQVIANACGLEGVLGGDLNDARNEIGEFVNASKAFGERLRNGLTEILMAQEYQDLTGQVIKRTIDIVNDLERGLINLITHEWLDRSTEMPVFAEGDITPSGPAVRAHAGTVTKQTDVDDLLASLGV